ncbi:MAG: helix-turn-helix transcriptional regulator [Solirubrobacteraceae bacterium]
MATMHVQALHDRDDEELLTFLEVSQILRVSENTLRWWRQIHRGPRFFKMGRRLRTTVAEVRHYIDEAEHGSESVG